MKEGDVIADRYRLVSVIGRGGMGMVWLADHLTLKTSCAIKVLHSNLTKHGDVLARFNREAQIAARLKSVNVVQVFDHGVMPDGQPFIAMELLEGESVRERLMRNTRLSIDETAMIVKHVCRALGRAHEVGLIHRDLKPENIFIVKDSDEEIVKVLDFGVAKASDALAFDGVDPTQTGAMVGTPYYMSPEQAMGLKDIDATTDLWALGAVVVECLTGKRAFTAPALGPLVVKIVGTYMPLPSELAPEAGTNADIDAWVRRTFERDRTKRFASAKEASDSFMVASGTIDSLLRSGGHPVISPRAITEDALVAIADTLVKRASAPPPTPIAPTSTLPMISARRTPPLPEPTPSVAPVPKSSNTLLWIVIAIAIVIGAIVVALVLKH